VQEVHHVAGEDCYLVKARVADTDALGELLRERFGRLKGVRNTRTTIVLSTVKDSGRIPLNHTNGAGE
jgi:Lrp/AsnC family leucine-responsive transcriptional regulator